MPGPFHVIHRKCDLTQVCNLRWLQAFIGLVVACALFPPFAGCGDDAQSPSVHPADTPTQSKSSHAASPPVSVRPAHRSETVNRPKKHSPPHQYEGKAGGASKEHSLKSHNDNLSDAEKGSPSANTEEAYGTSGYPTDVERSTKSSPGSRVEEPPGADSDAAGR